MIKPARWAASRGHRFRNGLRIVAVIVKNLPALAAGKTKALDDKGFFTFCTSTYANSETIGIWMHYGDSRVSRPGSCER